MLNKHCTTEPHPQSLRKKKPFIKMCLRGVQFKSIQKTNLLVMDLLVKCLDNTETITLRNFFILNY